MLAMLVLIWQLHFMVTLGYFTAINQRSTTFAPISCHHITVVNVIV